MKNLCQLGQNLVIGKEDREQTRLFHSVTALYDSSEVEKEMKVNLSNHLLRSSK